MSLHFSHPDIVIELHIPNMFLATVCELGNKSQVGADLHWVLKAEHDDIPGISVHNVEYITLASQFPVVVVQAFLREQPGIPDI